MIGLGTIVKFAFPSGDEEAGERFIVMELRGDRVLVEAINKMNIRPQFVYLLMELLEE
jgi:hypothetical protein